MASDGLYDERQQDDLGHCAAIVGVVVIRERSMTDDRRDRERLSARRQAG